jgi:hypothetical protein
MERDGGIPMKVTINRKRYSRLDDGTPLIFNDAEAYATIELCDDFFWVRRKGGKVIRYIALDTISDIIVEEE